MRSRNRSLTSVVLEPDLEMRSILWREFLDSFYLENTQGRIKLVEDEPPLTDGAWDAIVAAGVAWLCRKAGIENPRWTLGKARCAYPAWSPARNFRELRLFRVLAPPEFFIRNVYTSQSFMIRARTPQEWIDPEPLWLKRFGKRILEQR